MPSVPKCASCKRVGSDHQRFILIDPALGRHNLLLCTRCISQLPIRADDPILVTTDLPVGGPRIFAGGMIRSLARQEREVRLQAAMARRRAATDGVI